jgi:DNA-binding ferritin-like protein
MADSTHALWVDPLAFDPAENGAPYFPEKSQMKTAHGQFGNVFEQLYSYFRQLPMGELGAILVLLRAAAHVHQTHHWQTKGGHFYGDHLLFMRLYEDSQPFIDQIAERGVGAGHTALVDARLQMHCMNGLVNVWTRNSVESAEGMVSHSLAVEQCVVHCVSKARASLEAKGELSDGTDNLIQGVADKHEEFVYLLQQRGRTASTYDRRSRTR